jgi:hypothetical protein
MAPQETDNKGDRLASPRPKRTLCPDIDLASGEPSYRPAVDAASVPEPKRTRTGLFLENGWKNAGLPWSDKLDKARMYFPR